jgi:diaminopimelate decarboxylase
MNRGWNKLIKVAIQKYQAPFYLFDEDIIKKSIDSLQVLENKHTQIQNWFSFKTTPVKQFIQVLKKYDMGIEVVSEYELLAALQLQYNPSKIVINGVNKHCWLYKYPIKKLNVNFDSINELLKLIRYAKENDWVIGLRYHPKVEVDPDNPNCTTQFGLSSNEINEAQKIIENNNCIISTIHFHIGTQIIKSKSYESAIKETIKICVENKIYPKYFSCGGGFPIRYNENHISDIKYIKNIKSYIRAIPKELSSVESIWFENGRFISSKSAILVVQINGIKYRNGMRYLICNGGRTNHALVSDWEKHKYFIYPIKKSNHKILSTVCGPTCMAYDFFIRENLPATIKEGDYFIWLDAGAYHIPWETRFSNGLAKVLWYHKGNYKIIREKESFNQWWSLWE